MPDIWDELNGLKARINTLEAQEHNHRVLNLGSAVELTIATGVITRTQSYHTIDTEGDAASDNLDTISGGATGEILILRAANAARTVVVKDMTGNIQLAGDFSLDDSADTLLLVFDGTNWCEIAGSSNA